MYKKFAYLNAIAHDDRLIWHFAMMVVTFIVGLLVELIPFHGRIRPSWVSVSITTGLFAVIFLFHSPFVIDMLGGFNVVSEAFTTSRWVYPMGSLVFGVLIGKSINKGDREHAGRW
jgi:hypothetical protein